MAGAIRREGRIGEHSMSSDPDLSARTRAANVLRSFFKLPPFEQLLGDGLASGRFPTGFAKLAPNHYQYEVPTLRTARRHGLTFRLNLQQYNDWMVFFARPNPLCTEVVGLCPEGGTMIDVGANLGEFSLRVAQKVGPRGRVLSFEPFPPTLAVFRANVILNPGLPIEVIPCAVSDTPGSVHMRGTDPTNLGTVRAVEGSASDSDPLVQVVRLDDVVAQRKLDRVDLIKADVEGFEYRALAGGIETLRRFRPIVVLELVDRHLIAQGSSARAVVELLQGLGYTVTEAFTRAVWRDASVADGCETDIVARHGGGA
jgi:FkbM family methyltransferase